MEITHGSKQTNFLPSRLDCGERSQDLSTVTAAELRTAFASVVTQAPQHGANAVLSYGRKNKPHLRPTLTELADFYLKSEV